MPTSPSTASGQPSEPVIDAGHEQPGHQQHDAEHEHRAQADQHPGGQHLAVEQAAGSAPPVRSRSGSSGRAARRSARGGATGRPGCRPGPSPRPGRAPAARPSAASICSAERLRPSRSAAAASLLGLVAAAPGTAAALGRATAAPASIRGEKAGSSSGPARPAQSQPLAARRPARLQLGDFRSPARRPGPATALIHGSCSCEGLDPRGLAAAAASLTLQPGGLLAELLPLPIEPLDAAAAASASRAFEGVEPRDGVRGHRRPAGPGPASSLVQRRPLRPSARAGRWPGRSRGPGARRGSAPLPAASISRSSWLALGGQPAVAAGERLPVPRSRCAELLALGQQLDHLARPAVAVEDAVPRGLQFPHHLDQRNAVQPGGEAVEQFGGLGVARAWPVPGSRAGRRRRRC